MYDVLCCCCICSRDCSSAESETSCSQRGRSMLPPPGRQRVCRTKGSPWRIMREVDGCLMYRSHLSTTVTSPPLAFVVFPPLINSRVFSVALCGIVEQSASVGFSWRASDSTMSAGNVHSSLTLLRCALIGSYCSFASVALLQVYFFPLLLASR